MTDLIVNQVQSAGHLHLNRPQALNALTLDMVRQMHSALQTWANDDSIESVVVTGEGSRAFCAGGDVKAAYHAGRAGSLGDGTLTGDFFREEYQLNFLIANYDKPYLSWLDGITMGGGVGISVLGQYRVASEHMRFAMPETAIGLFPDVGGSYFLSRLGPIGTLLALTGRPLNAAAALKLGIATHFVPRQAGLNLVEQIGSDGVEHALGQLTHTAPQDDSLSGLESLAKRSFDSFQIDDILNALQPLTADRTIGSLAQETLETLAKRSPTSLRITLEQLRRGKELTLRDCLAMEYRMSQACMRGHDFFEGIRAVLVDKDHAPQWSPATLDEVTDDLVASHFADLGPRELQLP